jgi:hypothetical protein
MPYLENIQDKLVFVREKSKLDAYTVLLLGVKPTLTSSGQTGLEI